MSLKKKQKWMIRSKNCSSWSSVTVDVPFSRVFLYVPSLLVILCIRRWYVCFYCLGFLGANAWRRMMVKTMIALDVVAKAKVVVAVTTVRHLRSKKHPKKMLKSHGTRPCDVLWPGHDAYCRVLFYGAAPLQYSRKMYGAPVYRSASGSFHCCGSKASLHCLHRGLLEACVVSSC